MTSPSDDPTVGELSEGEILHRILSRIGRVPGVEVGPGDDAAVIQAPGGSVVATTDTLVNGPDFRLAWSSGYDLGWKAAAVNLADLAAMGARPTALLVALAMPNDTRASFLEQLADGLRAACDALAPRCGVVGGDLTVSDTLTIAVTALGSLDGRGPVLRSGARPGDVVAVAGDLGVAARGLDALFRVFVDPTGAPVPVDPDVLSGLPDRADVSAIDVQLRPRPPIVMGTRAAEWGATAMMDVSDGLVLDASRLANASGVTIDIDSAGLGIDARRALEGGEDHALLATFPPGAGLPDGFHPIGRVLPRQHAPVSVDGAAYEGRGGWDPYRDWDGLGG